MKIKVESFDKARHDRSNFSCGVNDIDDFIKTKMSQDIKRNLSAAYVVLDEDSGKLLSFFTLSQHALKNREEFKENKGRHEKVPATLLGIFAVNSEFQKRGIGKKIMLKIFELHIDISKKIGSASLVVESIDSAVDFYKRLTFQCVPCEINMLYLSTKNIQNILQKFRQLSL